jgi:Rod binding domain-containing protein
MNVSPTLSASGLDPALLKRTGAAKDFEALLLTEMLKSVREESGGWLASGEDEADNPAAGLGEEELANALAEAGGLGIASLINEGLNPTV